ncbi:hypothetical protein CFP56_033012 [Quercus suber]|uniref:Uncharacterized protein n=1 Tax=Quercus suber TaxID=58331 RepID=A0AAW0JFH7_QUESU
MKVISVLFARWKGAKITTEHPMHVLLAYQHATHIAKWATHATIADALPFHGEMSYNDKYMVWFRPRTFRHITKDTSYWDTLLRIMVKCELGSEIYTDYINAFQLTLDDAHAASNTSEPAVGRGQQAGGRQGHRGHQCCQRHTSSWRPTSNQCPTFVVLCGAAYTNGSSCVDGPSSPSEGLYGAAALTLTPSYVHGPSSTFSNTLSSKSGPSNPSSNQSKSSPLPPSASTLPLSCSIVKSSPSSF